MSRAGSGRSGPIDGPVRTCVGCRRRAHRSALLRVVAVGREPGGFLLRPDPRHRLPGRGAWVHPTAECLAAAEKRRAFARALRLAAPADLDEVREYVVAHTWPTVTDPPGPVITETDRKRV